jgi:DNA-binding NarL/FixJ family response regulator
MSRLRLVLAEDQVAVRAELRQLLEESQRITVVGEASDGLELLRLLDEVECDAVLLDLAMPRMSGLTFLEELRASPRGHPPVIVLSMHDDAGHVDRALELGASGYVLKSARPSEIVTAVEAAIAGGAYIQPTLARPLIRRHLGTPAKAPGAASSLARTPRDMAAGSPERVPARVPQATPARTPRIGAAVSPRQLELLRALSLGLGNKEIAHRLGITDETVKGYLKDLYARIGVSGRAAAVAWAIRARLID